MDKRLQSKIGELHSLCTERVGCFEYSKRAKIPSKVHSFIEIMNLRMLDFCESANTLIQENHIVPSVSLIRALFENTAITYRINLYVNNSLKSGKLLENFDDLISKIKFGTKYDKDDEATNILTHIGKLDKEYKGILKFYLDLCEFVHPNWDGVEGSYSELIEDKNYTELFRVINSEHPVFKWIESCFLLSVTVYLELFKHIKSKLPELTTLCENDLNNGG